MNVEPWNRLADVVVRWLLERGVVSACVLAVALVAYFVLRARVRLTAPLFAAALVVLVLPVERLLPARLALAPVARPVDYLATRVGPLPAVSVEEGPVEVVLTGVGAEASATPAPPVSAVAPRPAVIRPTTGAWLLLGWGAVVVALLGGLLRNQLRARRLVRGARPVDGPIAAECDRLRRGLGIRRPVLLAETDALSSPATWGFRRPVVVLPHGLAARLTAAEQSWVLLHELHHVRRGDFLQQLGQRLLQIAWWFDPMVWLANRMVDRQRECLCDDEALRRLEAGERLGGARAFVKVLEGAPAGPALPGLVGLWSEKRFVKRRLLRLLEDPTGPATGRAALTLALVAAAALPLARALVGPEPAPAASSEEAAVEGEEVASAALARAIDWIAARQLDDGRWPAGQAKQRARGGGGGMNDVGVSALSTLALLGVPAADRTDAIDAAIDRSVAYLLAIQDERTGLVGDQEGVTFVYNHGYATIALARARVARPTVVPAERLQLAVRFIERARNPYRGWRYAHVPDGDNDTSVTGLMLHALAAARDAGADVEERAFESGLRYLEEMTDPETGRTGYQTKGRWSARAPAAAESFPPELTEAMTALALSARLSVGVDAADAPAVQRGFARLAARPPSWAGGAIDFYYWWYGTEAMHRFGGEPWTDWKTHLVGALVERQSTEGAGAGSWPADDAWSGLGGRVYATALNALCLQRALQ